MEYMRGKGKLANSILNITLLLVLAVETILHFKDAEIKYKFLGYGCFFFLMMIAYIFLRVAKNITPILKKIFYSSYLMLIIWLIDYFSGSNSFMIAMMVASFTSIVLLYDRIHLIIHLIITEITCVISFAVQLDTISDVYGGLAYLMGMLLIFGTFLMVWTISGLGMEQSLEEIEESLNTQELLKIIHRKCDDADRAERIKSDFLASMSHEIRSPLNVMVGFNEMILRESKEPQIKRYAHDIAASGNMLLTLVNDILDYAKVETGLMKINEVSYNLGSLINDVCTAFAVRAQEKGLEFVVNVEENTPGVLYGDMIRLKQVMMNLLNEACNYTDEGKITLTLNYVKIDDDLVNLKISIKDTGDTITDDILEKMFTPFGFIGDANHLHIESVELNMDITQAILRALGTSLEVRTENGATTFFFNVKQKVEDWDGVGEYKLSAADPVREELSEYRPTFISPDSRILIVDDLPLNLSVASALLRDTQIQIDTALSGSASLAMCRDNQYDLILLDHMMPEMDGVETLKKMRGDRFNHSRYAPVIALTANAVSGARDQYLRSGFSDYVSKPINPRDLESVLLKFLPEEKILEPDEAMLATSSATADMSEDSDDSLISKLSAVPHIDVAKGIEATGGKGIYESAIQEFFLTMDIEAEKIEKLLYDGDFDNYIIKVHALKTAARLAGDTELSDMAKELEFAGKDGRYSLLNEKTPGLLTRLRVLRDELAPILDVAKEDEDPKADIDSAMLAEATEVMLEAAKSFDYDTIELVMNQLSDYALPSSYKGIYDQMRILMAQVAFEDIKTLLEKVEIG